MPPPQPRPPEDEAAVAATLRASLERAGQAHLLRFWPELDAARRAALGEALRALVREGGGEALREHCRQAARAYAQEAGGGPARRVGGRMEPVPPEFFGSACRSRPAALDAWQEEGLRQISQNKVAVLLLAGGQGTRLGVPYPKGMYDVGLPSRKTLYQIQAERIRQVEQLAGEKFGTQCTVPWWVAWQLVVP